MARKAKKGAKADEAARRDGRTTRARRQRRSRREQILEAARASFGEMGYHAASVGHIISRAGIARGTFYLYFDSKRAIFDELLEGYLKRISEAVARVSLEPEAPTPVAQIRANVERVVDVLADSRPLNHILLRHAVGLDAEFDSKLSEFYGRILELIEGALILGHKMGVVREADVGLLAACVLGSIKEVVNRYLLDDAPAEPFDRSAAVDEILAYNLHGILEQAR